MTKQRLTITLSASTLNKIDQLVDKKKIRSRSHAIETILQQQLKPGISTAVILAGGNTQKTQTIKPLISYQNRPLIFHILDHLQKFQISNIIILTNNRAKTLQAKISKKYPGLKVSYIFEDQPLGTAGALKNARHLLSESFYCLHGDIFTDINLQELAIFHQQQQALATIAVKPRLPHSSFDNIAVQGNQVTAFQPKTQDPNPSLVNSGVYLFEPQILELIPDKTPTTLEKDVFPQLAQAGKLSAFTFEGAWLDITTEDQYRQDLNIQKL